MRDDEIRRLLNESNPWWRSATAHTQPTAWTATNRLLKDRSTYDLGYRTRILEDIATAEPDGRLVVLTGPRRVGKSVTLIDAIAQLCAHEKMDPRQIIHVPTDAMQARDLRRSIALGRELTKSVDLETRRRRAWFFDEVTVIRGWSSVLKGARDNTEFGDDSVVVTGSRLTSDEDVEGNLIAGRSGTSESSRVRQLLPISFREYLKITCPDLPIPQAIHPAYLQSEESRAELQTLGPFVDAFDLAWQAYLTSGGFPRAVHEYVNTGTVSSAFARDVTAWLRSDVDPDAPIDSTPRLLVGLSERMSSPLNVSSSSTALGFTGRSAFQLRLNRLFNTHAAIQCRQINEAGHEVAGAQFKLYLTDPIISWCPSLTSPGLATPEFTKLSEAALGVALARAIESRDEGRWKAQNTVGYSRTGSNNEIDFAPVRLPSLAGSLMTTPIESKWVDDAWRRDALTIEGKYGRGVVASKSILNLENPSWAIPAPLVAMLIG